MNRYALSFIEWRRPGSRKCPSLKGRIPNLPGILPFNDGHLREPGLRHSINDSALLIIRKGGHGVSFDDFGKRHRTVFNIAKISAGQHSHKTPFCVNDGKQTLCGACLIHRLEKTPKV